MNLLWEAIKRFFTYITNAGDSLEMLQEKINAINFSSGSTINTFFGNIRHIVGSEIYLLLMVSFQIGILFLLYKIISTGYYEIRKIIG